MSPEPLLSPLRTPDGGWPRCARRVELIGDLTLDQAVFALAERSRLEHIAVVALFQGVDLWAYPHQSVIQIADGFRRMRQMDDRRVVPVHRRGAMRWTPHAKLAVVLAARERLVERKDLLDVYGLTAPELADWEQRFARFGLEGLKVGQVQSLRLSPPSPDALAAGFTSEFTRDVPQEKAHG